MEINCCCSVAKSCLTLCDPTDYSTPGFPVLHRLSEFAQTHVHWISDAIQPSHSLWPPLSPAPKLSQHQSLFQRVGSLYQVAKVFELQLQHQSFQISFRIDWFDLLAVQGILKSLLQHRRSKASVLQGSAFFMIQLLHPYMTTGKTIALTRWTFVSKVMSRFVIAFRTRSKRLLFLWLQSPPAVIVEPKEMKPVSVSIASPSTCHEVMGLDVMILLFECWVLSQLFHSPLSHSSRGSLVSLLFLPLE